MFSNAFLMCSLYIDYNEYSKGCLIGSEKSRDGRIQEVLWVPKRGSVD